MNFSKNIKEEILSKPPKDKCCKKAFLSGIIRGTGKLFSDGDFFGVEFVAPTEECAFLISNYLKLLYDYDLREVEVKEDRLNKKDKFTLILSGEKAESILKDLRILIDKEGEVAVNLKFYENLDKECCVKAFFRGLFLSIGNCIIPSKEDGKNLGYHLELVFSHYTPALETSEKLAEADVLTKITRRKESFILYIKSAEEIKNFTAFLGAPVSVLKLTELMINRDISNNSNRQRNCDMGNLNKQTEAFIKQLSAIEKIEQTIGLNELKEDLKETAIKRKEKPEFTLNELALDMGITKSCLNHRLRKLLEIADNL